MSPFPVCPQHTKQTRTIKPRETHHADRQYLPSTFRSRQLTSGHVWIIHIACSLLLSSTSNQNTNCCLQICITPNSCLPWLRGIAICLMVLPTQVVSVWQTHTRKQEGVFFFSFWPRSVSVFLKKCNSNKCVTSESY